MLRYRFGRFQLIHGKVSHMIIYICVYIYIYIYVQSIPAVDVCGYLLYFEVAYPITTVLYLSWELVHGRGPEYLIIKSLYMHV